MDNEKRPLASVLRELKANEAYGLTDAEALLRQAQYGRNELAPRKAKGRFDSLLAIAKEPMIWLLVGAAAIYFALGDALDAWVMLFAAIPIAGLDVYIDYKTENALEKLRKIASPITRVVRNGAERELDSAELVPGDVFLLKEGDVVPADAIVLEASDFRLDESALTGESMLVDKMRSDLYSEDVFNNAGTVFGGTTVMGGRGRCVASKTGQRSQYGKIGGMIAGIEQSKTPLQKNIERIVTLLGIIAGFLLLFLFLMQLLVAHKPWSVALIDAVSLAIAAIPEEFPITFALFLSLGAWSLARMNALVKRMAGVETLGSVNVVCTDKTGTLTTGRMTLTHVFFGGEVIGGSEFVSGPHAKEVLEAAALACEKNPFDPMERSIFEFVAKIEPAENVQKRWTLEAEYAFDNRAKYMSHVWKRDGKLGIFAKGSLEGILKNCRIGPHDREAALKANERLASQGMRLLALASKPLERSEGREKDEKGLQFLALLAFSDPVREGVRQAMSDCETAGVRVVMLTGDHKSTASAVAKEVGFANPQVMDGSAFAGLAPAERALALRDVSVFSRVLPEQKLEIVTELQNRHDTVAVTGDGINDALALKKADIGVAMGQRGTEVAREAATLVLLDDNFVTIIEAIRQGRVIYDNLKKAFSYLIAFHIPLFLGAFVIPLLGLPLLLMPIHLIFLELFLHPVISIVFQQEPAEENVMRRPPRSRDTPLVDKSEVPRLVLEGSLLFAVSLAAYWGGLQSGEASARSLAFTTLIFGQVLLLITELSSKNRPTVARTAANKSLVITVVLTIALWSLLGSNPSLAEGVFKIAPLSAGVIIEALALGAIPIVANSAWKRARPPKGRP